MIDNHIEKIGTKNGADFENELKIDLKKLNLIHNFQHHNSRQHKRICLTY